MLNTEGVKSQTRRQRRANGHDTEAPSRRLDYVFGDQLGDDLDTFDDELVEGLIGRIAMAVLYGDSNSGKTFLAIELAACVSLGRPWLGRPTVAGVVVILATEAERSVRRRLKVWTTRHGVALPHVVVVRSPINLFDGQADVGAVLAIVAEVERHTGRKVELIVGDTLARISAGANENSGEDMGVVMRNADAIRAGAGAAFLWIHHVGKDAAKGMRGWSGMRAAIDTELEVASDEAAGVRSVEATKQRDLPGKGDRLGFRLELVPLGFNRWGTARGSCVVVSDVAPPKQARGKRPSEIAGAIVELLSAQGTGMKKSAIVKHFDGRYTDGAVYRELAKMRDAGRVHEVVGIVALLSKGAA
jgi:hypothetical protein